MLVNALQQFADKTATQCNVKGFLGFKPWYQYLTLDDNCVPKLAALNDVWNVAAAIFEMILRVGTLVAVGFIIFGGIKLSMAQGEPEHIKNAKDTIINAVVGAVITFLAATIVSIIAGRLL